MSRDYDPEDLVERLRKWAKGSLPLMAAVDFLINSGQSLPIGYIENYREGQPWIDFQALKDALDAGTYGGHLSSGEWATLKLACSLARGELDDTFWRIDPERKAAFIQALTNHQQ